MKTFAIRELSVATGIRLSTWRRWVRQFLPPQHGVGLRCGVTRELSFEEAFFVFLCGCVVRSAGIECCEVADLFGELGGFGVGNVANIESVDLGRGNFITLQINVRGIKEAFEAMVAWRAI